MTAKLNSYSYLGVDTHGAKRRGRIEASTQTAAATAIKRLGIVPVTVTPSLASEVRNFQMPSLGGGVRLKPLALATRQFAVLVRSGVTLVQSLIIIAEQTEDKRLSEAFGQVAEDVKSGVSLTEGMRKHRVFPRLMLALIEVGESSGTLAASLDSAASNLATELRLRQRVVAAMTYPAVVLMFALAVAVAMIVVVVPVFAKMFASFGAPLPAATQALVTLSATAKFWLPALFVAIAAAVWWWRKHGEDDRVREVKDSTLMKVPVFGPLIQKIAIARFTRNLGTMLRAGVPLVQATEITGQVSNNWVVEKAVTDAIKPMQFGQSLGSQLGEATVFPPMVTQMVNVGESSGALDSMLDQVATFYEAEVEDTTSKLASIIEPIMIVLVGSIVGGIVISLYLPIFSMSTVINGGG